MIARVRLGRTGPAVSRIGFGAMGLSGTYGTADDAESEATIRHALDRGVNLIDTADFYGSGHNELLIGRAIRGRRDEVVLSVKFGAQRAPGGGWGKHEATPSAMRNYLAYSLVRLGVDAIDIYTPSRVDPSVPIEEVVGALGEMVTAGYIRHIGLSEVSPEILRRAAAVHPIVALQIEYSLWTRDIETAIVPTARELGIGIVAYSPLSRGFIGGDVRSRDALEPGDIRRHTPRFAEENFAKNLALADVVAEIAAARWVTAAQVAIAWVLSRGEDIVPIPGTRRAARLDENLAAADLVLGAGELARLNAAMPPGAASGERYAAMQMGHVYKP